MLSCRLGTVTVSNDRPFSALETAKAVQKLYPLKAEADPSFPASGGPLSPAPSYPVRSGFHCGVADIVTFVACCAA